jgi:putative ABC transport system substrate-binding protein
MLLCALTALLLSATPSADDSKRVAVLITSKGPCRDAAEALIRSLGNEGTDCELLVVPAGDAQARQKAFERVHRSSPAVIVTGGAMMTSEALEAVPEAPVVFCLRPNILDAEYLREDSPQRARVAGVTSDVAPAQQVDWIRRTCPACKRVAVLCSARSERTAESLAAAGRARGVEITPVRALRDKFPAAIDALNAGKFDSVVMIPDSQVYNSPTVQRLLLWGVRYKRPVWAFSDKVVKAGALAGIYSDPAQVGSQTAEIVRQILSGNTPASIGVRYPRSSGRAVNLHTAEMIGVRLDSRAIGSGVKTFGERK